MADLLSVNRLCGDRGIRQVIEGLSFAAQAGEVHQILGANGSGKSTLLRLLAGLSLPSQGEVLWNGNNIYGAGRDTFLRDSFYLGHKISVADDLTALENLAYFIDVRGESSQTNYAAALEKVAFSASHTEYVGKISAGQKQRVALARLLLCRARIWFLDEPFNALDGDGKTLIENLIDDHCAAGGIALIATHQKLADNARTVHQLSLN